MSTDNDNLLEHQYDGIQEYDNPAPSWWSFVFIGSIVFSIAYVIYYHQGPGPTIWEEYEEAVAQNDEVRAQYDSKAGTVDEATLATLAADPKAVAKGKALFENSECVGCHKPDGGGLVGPNLTDGFQVIGKTRMDIFNTIAKGGREGKSMIPFEGKFKPEDLRVLAAYVITLRHTNVTGGKAAEGEEVAPF